MHRQEVRVGMLSDRRVLLASAVLLACPLLVMSAQAAGADQPAGEPPGFRFGQGQEPAPAPSPPPAPLSETAPAPGGSSPRLRPQHEIEPRDPSRFREWRLAGGLASTPAEKEASSSNPGRPIFGGDSVHSTGLAGSISYCQGHATPYSGGLAWSIGLAAANYNTTPSTYTPPGGVTYSSDGSNLHLTTIGVEGFLGFCYVTEPDTDDGLQIYLEAGPFLGAGYAAGQTVTEVAPATFQGSSGTGGYVDGGLRGGLHLIFGRFVIGADAGYQFGVAEISSSLPHGGTGKLKYTQSGFGTDLMLGWRF
jgi:hypothetical protein